MAIAWLRVARKAAAWDADQSDETLRDSMHAEFRGDLRLSVYHVEDAQADAVRVAAEHSAGSRLDPPREVFVIDCYTEGVEAVVTPGETGFAFADAAHRELLLEDGEHALDLFRAIASESEKRGIEVEKETLRQYVREQLAAGNEEWVRFVSSAPKGARWARFAKPSG